MRTTLFCYRGTDGTISYGYYSADHGVAYQEVAFPPNATQATVAAYLCSLWSRGIFPAIPATVVATIERLPA